MLGGLCGPRWRASVIAEVTAKRISACYMVVFCFFLRLQKIGRECLNRFERERDRVRRAKWRSERKRREVGGGLNRPGQGVHYHRPTLNASFR